MAQNVKLRPRVDWGGAAMELHTDAQSTAHLTYIDLSRMDDAAAERAVVEAVLAPDEYLLVRVAPGQLWPLSWPALGGVTVAPTRYPNGWEEATGWAQVAVLCRDQTTRDRWSAALANKGGPWNA